MLRIVKWTYTFSGLVPKTKILRFFFCFPTSSYQPKWIVWENISFIYPIYLALFSSFNTNVNFLSYFIIHCWLYILMSDSSSLEKSPLKYFMEEMYSGNSLQSTTTLGNEKERERVYDTIFRLPWRCELVIFHLIS